MRQSRGFLVVGAGLLALAVSDGASCQTISNGTYSVTFDKMGLITAPPDEGLISTYGPRIAIVPDIVELFGIEYRTPAGMFSVVGESSRPDYGGRTHAQFVSAVATPSTAHFVSKSGDLEIEHEYSFDPISGDLIVSVLLRNTGTSIMDMVFYTREWWGDELKAGVFPADWEPHLPKAPRHVWRLAWMPNNILPGQTQAAAVLALELDVTVPAPLAVDVPLSRWKNSTWPNGVDFGTCWGIAFTDFDHDGFLDVYSNASRDLWQGLGGTDWVIAANLNSKYPGNFEYGSGWADYDNDQLPDFGTEPRGGCMALLHNLGAASFDNVGNDSNIVDVQPCNAEAETISVADVDGDGNLDWFLPTYPSWLGSSGNWFLYNEGLDPVLNEYTFAEQSGPAGLDNPPLPVNRPEGAEFVDYDYDGDVDLYSNNTIYRNLSTPGTALFEAMTENGSGVVFSDVLDEGAKFIDYDMDGDMDLVIAFCDSSKGVRMFENLGDGTFAVQPKSLFDSYNTGLCLGLSCADWDNDGDVDVTSSEVFRRNQWIETALRHYTVATHNITANHITDAVPAWGDFDKDGDLDSALGNWGNRGRLYQNDTYDSTTADVDRRYVRVKPVRDSTVFDDGLESEYGAQVTIRIPLDSNKRTAVVSTSGGYLNQDEYTRHFALPADPDPANPDVDVVFNALIDFKGASNQGTARLDKHVNPVLGAIDFAQLDEREIVVYRSGRVILDGLDFLPVNPLVPLTTTTDTLILPAFDTMQPVPALSPGADWFVGIEVSTSGATVAQRVEELVVDGQLDASILCGTDLANVYVWDVTNPAAPVLADGGLRALATRPRNQRSYLPIDAVLEPGKFYRIVCRVTSLRATPIFGPVVNGVMTTNGGLSFQDATPCTGAGAAAATVDANNVYVSIRFRPEPAGSWADAGHALAGTNGDPLLVGSGTLREGDLTTIALSNALASAPAFMVVGLSQADLNAFGGVLVPSFDVFVPGFVTDATGALSVAAAWPTGLPSGLTFFIQMLILDSGAVKGVAMSNAIAGCSSF